jgi:NADPH:quinone reductase-like Zn-dependent oxidoreductase
VFGEQSESEDMKALVFRRYGGADQVGFSVIPRPAPKPDEILVQVQPPA